MKGKGKKKMPIVKETPGAKAAKKYGMSGAKVGK